MRGAIFDLDGTLAETAGDLIGAVNVLLKAENMPLLDPIAERKIAGRGGKALIRRGWELGGQSLNEDEISARAPAFLEAYGARLDRETYVYEGVIETLGALRDDGWLLGVCTNKPEGLAVELMRRLGLAQWFGAILGADSVPARKPDPGHFWSTADAIGAERARSVLIGDTETDHATADAARAPVVLVSFGYALTPVEELAPTAVIDHYSELPSLLPRLVD